MSDPETLHRFGDLEIVGFTNKHPPEMLPRVVEAVLKENDILRREAQELKQDEERAYMNTLEEMRREVEGDQTASEAELRHERDELQREVKELKQQLETYKLIAEASTPLLSKLIAKEG